MIPDKRQSRKFIESIPVVYPSSTTMEAIRLCTCDNESGRLVDFKGRNIRTNVLECFIIWRYLGKGKMELITPVYNVLVHIYSTI